MRPKHYLDQHDIAELTGLSIETIRRYHKDAQTRRDQGKPRPADFPSPDALTGTRPKYAKPGWKPETITLWQQNRPHATPRNPKQQ